MEGDGGRARARAGAARRRGRRASAARRACCRPGSPASSRPTGSPPNPHLTDQVVAVRVASPSSPPASTSPGTVETPRAGVTITRDAYGVPNVRAGSAGRRVVRRRLRGRAGPARGARAVPPLDPGPARRGARREPAGVRHRRAPRLLHARRAARASSRKPARRAAGALRRLRRRRQRLDRARGRRPVAAPARVRAARPDARRRGRRWTRPRSASSSRAPCPPTTAASWRTGARCARSARKRFAQLPAAAPAPARRPRCPPRRAASRPSPAAAARDERRGYKASQRFLKGLKPPKAAAARAHVAGRLPARGGSFHFALRGPGNTASLFSAPQLGFSIPELFVEYEVHAPGLDVRGVTGPGIPVIAAGHNGRIAWGITSGLGDDDDLYVERLAGKERYRFKGRTPEDGLPQRDVQGLRREVRQAPLLPHRPRAGAGDAAASAPTRAATRSGAARCRRSSASPRSTTRARSRRPARAAAKLTWNENLLVADDGGHIGWWHPGLLPLRPKRWDERLPMPGTGEAEWRGLLPRQGAPEGDRPAAGLPRQLEQPAVGRAGPTATPPRRRPTRATCTAARSCSRRCARTPTARSRA